MNSPKNGTSRRSFWMTAGTLAAGSLAACEARSVDPAGAAESARTTGVERAPLNALSECVLPEELGLEGRRAAAAASIFLRADPERSHSLNSTRQRGAICCRLCCVETGLQWYTHICCSWIANRSGDWGERLTFIRVPPQAMLI